MSLDDLNRYYKEVFPTKLLYEWLSYGDAKKFERREIAFELACDVFLKYNSFGSLEEFEAALCQTDRNCPIRVNIGPFYCLPPKYGNNALFRPGYQAVEKELCIDVDVDDFDAVRFCCKSKQICSKCWLFIVVAVRALDFIIVSELGFKHRLWVFSGRRGVHCWIADTEARNNKVHELFADFLIKIHWRTLDEFFRNSSTLSINLLLRIIPVIDKYVERIVMEQNLFGSDERIETFLQAILGKQKDKEMHCKLLEAINKVPAECRWGAFETAVKNGQEEEPDKYKYLIEKAKLYIAYPRIDVPVSRNMTHLLKAPFNVHQDTKKVAEPFDPNFIDDFNPFNLPDFRDFFSKDLSDWPALNVFKHFINKLKEDNIIQN